MSTLRTKYNEKLLLVSCYIVNKKTCADLIHWEAGHIVQQVDVYSKPYANIFLLRCKF